MATLYEHYIVNDDNVAQVWDFNWFGQTFTPSETHKISKVRLLIYRAGTPGLPGTVTVGIRATSGGVPTGSDLVAGTFNGNVITTNTAGAWKDILLAASFPLVANIQYAIVLRAPSGDGNNEIRWREDISAPAYGGGTYVFSGDSGASWATDAAKDFMFEEWGNPFRSITVDPTIVGNKVSLEAVRNIEMVYGGRFYMNKSGNAVYESRYHRNV